MPTLLEVLSDGSFDLLNKKDTSGAFAQKLQMYKDIVVSEYLKYKVDLNRAIAKIAVKDTLNDDQIQRIVEEVNNQVYLVKYNQMKASPDRDVEFDIASVAKVKEIAGSGEVNKSAYKKEEEKEAGTSGGGLEKRASWETEGSKGDSLNFLNYSSHEFSSLSPEVIRSKDSLVAEKLASLIKTKDDEFKSITNKIASDTYIVAEALVKYDRFGLDVQDIFSTICKEASITKNEQIMYKNAVMQKVAQLKEYRQLPKEYELELGLCSCEKVANEFSLGQYSFLKEATETTQSNKDIPMVTTDKKVIKGVNDLIDMARDIKAQKKTASEQFIELKGIKEKTASLSMEELEKLAAGGVAAFGKALLGVGKKKAGKALEEATEHMNGLANDSRLTHAKNMLSELEGASKDVSSHSRMKNVKDGLNSAKDNLNSVLEKNDNVLNSAATQGPVKRLFNTDYRAAKKEIGEAKNQVGNAQKQYNAQSSRLKGEVGGQVNTAKRKLEDIGNEIGLPDAQKRVSESQQAYEKAVGATRSARRVAGAAVAVPAAAVAIKNQKKEQSPYNYA